MLDSPTGTGRWALGAGEETRRWWLIGSYSPTGPEAKDHNPSEAEIASDPFPTLLLVVSDLLPLCSPESGLWLGVSGPEGRRALGPPVWPRATRDPFSSAIFCKKENNFHVFLLSCASFLQGPTSLVQTPHRAECSTPCRGNQAGDDKNSCSASCCRSGAHGGRPWGSW